MLKCGECTFLGEGELDKCVCTHPEAKTRKEVVATCSYPHDCLTRSGKTCTGLDTCPHRIEARPIPAFRKYEDDCFFGYNDVWAARGAAKLIRIEQPTDASSGVNLGPLVGVVANSLTKPSAALALTLGAIGGLAIHHMLKK